MRQLYVYTCHWQFLLPQVNLMKMTSRLNVPPFVRSQLSLALLGSIVVSRNRHPLSYIRVPSRLRSCRLLSAIFVGREDEADYHICCDEIEQVVNDLEANESYGDILFSLLDLVWDERSPTLLIRMENEDASLVAHEWVRIIQLAIPFVYGPDLTPVILSLFRVAVEFEKLLGIATRPEVDPSLIQSIKSYPQEHLDSVSREISDPDFGELSDPLWSIRTALTRSTT